MLDAVRRSFLPNRVLLLRPQGGRVGRDCGHRPLHEGDEGRRGQGNGIRMPEFCLRKAGPDRG